MVTEFAVDGETNTVTYNNNIIVTIGPVNFTYISGTNKIEQISVNETLFQVDYDNLNRISKISDTSENNINYIYYDNSLIINSIKVNNNTPFVTYTNVDDGLPTVYNNSLYNNSLDIIFDRNTTSNMFFIHILAVGISELVSIQPV